MAVMFAYALYKQEQAEAAWNILDGLYIQSQNFEKSRMYPGIPEYFNPQGRGMYPYLTGSAAWYLFTLLTESFGIKGDLGDLVIEPKLVAKQFKDAEDLVIKTLFSGKELHVTYKNPNKLGFGNYIIGKVSINGVDRQLTTITSKVQIPHKEISTWPDNVIIEIILE